MFMSKAFKSLRNFVSSEEAASAVEYAVMIALILVVCIATVTKIGTKANTKFQSAASVL